MSHVKAVPLNRKEGYIISGITFLLLAGIMSTQPAYAGEAEAIAEYNANMATARSGATPQSIWTGVPIKSIVEVGALAYSASHTLKNPDTYSYVGLIGAASSIYQPTDVHDTVSGRLGF